jgi:hypothetical protein
MNKYNLPKEYTVWATKSGQPDYEEVLITTNTDLAHVEKAKVWAKANGFDRIRVSIFNWEKPNFSDKRLINV